MLQIEQDHDHNSTYQQMMDRSGGNCGQGTAAPSGLGETIVFASQQFNLCVTYPASGGSWTLPCGAATKGKF